MHISNFYLESEKLFVAKRQKHLLVPRFGMRLLLLVISGFAIGIGWLANLNRQAKHEREAIENLKPYEPIVLYSYHFDSIGKRIPGAKPPAKTWVTWIFDEYPFVAVEVLLVEQCEKLKDLQEIKKLKHLKRLSLRHVRPIASLHEIEQLTDLESLSLEDCENLDDISALRNLQKLESLRFSACPRLADLTPLASLPMLVDVDLWSNELINNVDFLSSAHDLEFVSISGKLDSIDGLKNSRKLTKLYLDLKNTVGQSPEMFDCLSKCELLENVSIHHGNLTNLDWLEASASLKSLRIHSVGLRDVQALRGMQNLENVAIWDAPLLLDLSGFDNLNNLKELDVTGTGISDFVTLGRLPKLEVLVAKSSKKLTSLIGLKSCPGLRRLELDRCSSLASLKYIESVGKLQVLGCYDCDELADISSLRELKRLQRVNFFGSENVVGGEFLLDLNIAPEFLNFAGTKVTWELQEQLREKYRKAEIRGRRRPRQ